MEDSHSARICQVTTATRENLRRLKTRHQRLLSQVCGGDGCSTPAQRASQVPLCLAVSDCKRMHFSLADPACCVITIMIRDPVVNV
jgi:hypothetical protein